MKIIGKTEVGYFVEATEAELLQAAGFRYLSEAPVEMFCGNDRQRSIRIGTTIDFVEPTRRLRALVEQEAKVRQNAAMLRGLADMLEGLTPSQIIAPAEAPAETDRP